MTVQRGGAILVIGALLVATACDGGGDGGAIPAPTRPTTAVSTTPSATPSTEAAGAATPTLGAGGVSHVPVLPRDAREAGRNDCPNAWLVAENAHLSVCYPPDHYAEVTSLPPNPQEWLVIRLVQGPPVAQTPSTLGLAFTATYEPPNTCEFEAEQIDRSAQTALAPYVVADTSGIACTARTSYAVQFKGSVPTQPQALQFRAEAVTDAELDLAKNILSTLRPR